MSASSSWEGIRMLRRSLPVAALLTLFLASVVSPLTAVEPPKPGMVTVYLVLLKKGPQWTPEKTDATKAIQEGHMANIKRLWMEKKM